MKKKGPRFFKIGNLAATVVPQCTLPSICTLKTTCGDEGTSLKLCRAGGSWVELPDPMDDVEIAIMIREMRQFARRFAEEATGIVITAEAGRLEKVQRVLAREERNR